MTNSPAGWYRQADGRQRYWDGATWTEHFAPGGAEKPAAVASAGAMATQAASARPWFKKKRFIIPAGLVGLIIVASSLSDGASTATVTPAALGASTSPTPSQTAAAPKTTAPTPAATPTVSTQPSASKPSTAPPAPKPKPVAPTLTVAQENAKGKALDYLDYAGFSRKGLVEQLKFEGYKTKDIEAALATMKVDWNAEVAEKAEAYMSYSSFSRSGLISQLKFEGFTSKQAAYGAKSVGL